MEEEKSNSTSKELPKEKKPLNKLLTPLLLLILIVAVSGGAYFLGKTQKNGAPETSPIPFASETPASDISGVSTEVTEESPSASPTSSPLPSASSTPSPTPSPTPTSAGMVQFKPTLGLALIPFKITNPMAIVDESEKSSFLCAFGAKFFFTGKVTSNKSGTATYQWVKSDGSTSPIASITFSAAQTNKVLPVFDWTVYSRGNYWVKLHVITPNDISSPESSFKFSCH